MCQWPGFGTVPLLGLSMEIIRTEVTLSFTQKMEMRTWSLNPEAPEFFPARNVSLSAPDCPIYPVPPTNPPFLHYSTLSFHPHVFSATLFSYPSYPYYPQQYAVQSHFLTPEKFAATASVPVTEPVSFLELFKTKMVPEGAQEPGLMARKENMGGTRRQNKDKNYRRNKRYGKDEFVRSDSTQACKKVWRAKNNSYSSGDSKYFVANPDPASFERSKVQGRSGNKREKHPPIPLKGDGKETTVMIKNIPNRYTREMLKEFLDQHCMITNREAESHQNAAADDESLFSAFDFLYLPIDFVTKSNKGYAFVNFTNPGAARKFFAVWHDRHWDYFQSNKIREIYCAKLQGMEQLVKHFERMEFPSEDFQPLIFNPARNGSKQKVKETFVGRCTGSLTCTKPNPSR